MSRTLNRPQHDDSLGGSLAIHRARLVTRQSGGHHTTNNALRDHATRGSYIKYRAASSEQQAPSTEQWQLLTGASCPGHSGSNRLRHRTAATTTGSTPENLVSGLHDRDSDPPRAAGRCI